LAQHEVFFDPPSSPLEQPIKTFTPVPAPEDSLKKVAGNYVYKPFRYIKVVERDGEAWCDIPGVGAHRMEPAGDLKFYSQGLDAQFEFVRGVGGGVSKLLYYSAGSRSVAPVTDSGGGPEALLAKIDKIKSLKRSAFSSGLASKLPKMFAYATDTLRVRLSSDRDTIELSYGAFPPQPFLPLDEEQAFSPVSEDRIALVRNGEGAITGLEFTRPAGIVYLPALGYKPRKPADLFPDSAAPDKPASDQGGSGKDTYVDFGAKHRYGCAEDGRYLVPGDGWVDLVRKGPTGDSISMHEPGDGLVIKVTGQAGKRIRLDLVACSGTNPKRRILLGLHGGPDEKGPYPDLLSEPDWVKPAAKGDTLSYSPIPIPSDPYYLDLRSVGTQESDSVYFSFDGYKAWSD
jgi:hypothetical protein